MKCLCGYEKIGEIKVQVPAKDILYISGKKERIEDENSSFNFGSCCFFSSLF